MYDIFSYTQKMAGIFILHDVLQNLPLFIAGWHQLTPIKRVDGYHVSRLCRNHKRQTLVIYDN